MVVFLANVQTQLLANAYEGMKPDGIIAGKVVEAETNNAIAKAQVSVLNLGVETITDSTGRFTLELNNYGTYTVVVTAEGYFRQTVQYVSVTSSSPRYLLVELRGAGTSSSVDVTDVAHEPRSIGSDLTLFADEILRSPASVNDLNRALMVSPMITTVEDASNDLIIRGGAPAEVGYYVDGIFMQSISHLPQFGGNGGLITLLNMDFVRKVDVSVGIMRASTGNALSGMVSIEQVNGSSDALHGQLDLNATGFSANLQGPLSESSSFFATARQSYVDALVALLKVGDAPQFRDAQFKIHKQFTNHDISVTGIYGKSDFNRDVKGAEEDLLPTFGQERYEQYVVGARLRDSWSDHLTSVTSAGIHRANYDYTWYAMSDSSLADRVNGAFDVVNIRHASTFQANQNLDLQCGTELRLSDYSHRDTLGQNSTQQIISALFADGEFKTDWIGAYLGFRLQWYNAGVEKSLDQRFTFWVAPLKNFVISTSVSSVSQLAPPYLYVSQSSAPLRAMRSSNMELQLVWSPSIDQRLSLTAYLKDYRNMPRSAGMPYTFLLDEVAGASKTYRGVSDINMDADARTYGVEFTYNKKLSHNWMLHSGVSVFRSIYYNGFSEVVQRSFNNSFIAVAQLMWSPWDDITLSSRLSVSRGRPYVPINTSASIATNAEVLDVAQTNSLRLPLFSSVSIRADKRWYYESSTITVYISVMNVANTRNVKGYVWNAQQQSIQPNYMWGIIPVFGVEWDW